tara:strand:- start:340 stop:561 length:222 start_codon:yes stop_codon:yes gene_type:complete
MSKWTSWASFNPKKIKFLRFSNDPDSAIFFKSESKLRSYLKKEFPDSVFKFRKDKWGRDLKFIDIRDKKRDEY